MKIYTCLSSSGIPAEKVRMLFETLVGELIADLRKNSCVLAPGLGSFKVKELGDGRRTVFFSSDQNPVEAFVYHEDMAPADLRAGLWGEVRRSVLSSGEPVDFDSLGRFLLSSGGRLSFVPSVVLREQLQENVSEESVVTVKEDAGNPVEEVFSREVFTEAPESEEDEPDPLPSTEQVRYAPVEPAATSEPTFHPAESRESRVYDEKPLERPRRKKQWLVAFFLLFVFVGFILWRCSGSRPVEEDLPTEETPFRKETTRMTLPELSELHYGERAFWVYIYESNRATLKYPTSIPEKASLVIPDLMEVYGVDVSDSVAIRKACIKADKIMNFNN